MFHFYSSRGDIGGMKSRFSLTLFAEYWSASKYYRFNFLKNTSLWKEKIGLNDKKCGFCGAIGLSQGLVSTGKQEKLLSLSCTLPMQ